MYSKCPINTHADESENISEEKSTMFFKQLAQKDLYKNTFPKVLQEATCAHNLL